MTNYIATLQKRICDQRTEIRNLRKHELELSKKIRGLEYEIEDLSSDNELLKNQKTMLREDLRSKKLLATDIKISVLKELQNEITLRIGTYRSDDSITILKAMSIIDDAIETIIEKGAKDGFEMP